MEYTFNAYYTLIAGTFVLLLGRLLVYKIPFLRNYNIPEPVAGGLIAAILAYLVYLTFGVSGKLALSFRLDLCWYSLLRSAWAQI